jgi:hypothetical protein
MNRSGATTRFETSRYRRPWALATARAADAKMGARIILQKLPKIYLAAHLISDAKVRSPSGVPTTPAKGGSAGFPKGSALLYG